MFRMNKELLQVQEWTQKCEHALTPINTAKVQVQQLIF